MSIYAVNGKTPVAAWIPSRDTAGNGTTTLTDLVGSNNGTLTDMDAATDWVADTGAGGVRALDFDGVNDRVLSDAQTGTSGDRSVSAWVYARNITSYGGIISSFTSAANSFEVFVLDSSQVGGGYFISSLMVVNYEVTINTWHHWVVTQSGDDYVLYRDGASVSTATRSTRSGTTATTVIGARGAGNFFDGRLDDIRVWNQALSSSDISYLYNSGTGRGITTIQTRRRRDLGGYGL